MQSQETKISASFTDSQKFILNKRIHSQVIHSLLIMSGKMFEMGSLFERIILNKDGEHVMLNNLDVTIRRLKRSCIIYFGASTNITNGSEIVYIDSLDQLKKYFGQLDANYDKGVTFHVMYEENKSQEGKIQTFLRSQNKFIVKNHPILPKNDENITFQQNVCITLSSIKSQQRSYQFPSYSEISIEGNNSKINQQRQTMYTFFAGFDFCQASQDLVKLYEYILQNQIFFCAINRQKQELMQIIKHYKSMGFRNSKTMLHFYTGSHCCYQLINMCLRSLIDPRDLAYVRLLFFDLYLSVADQFTKQQKQRKKLNQYQQQLFRACFLSKNQIDNLQKLVDHYIQMNGFLSTTKNRKMAEHFFYNKYNDQIKVLFNIKLPFIERSYDIFHCFAQISKQYSKYDEEQEVLFNPLNALKVLGVHEINDKYYQIGLQYANIYDLVRQYQKRVKLLKSEQTPRQMTKEQRKKNDIEQKISANFEYHKCMFTMNRTQGEVFWRNLKKQCSHPFYSGLINKLLNKQKLKMFTKQPSIATHKFKFINASTLYRELKKFVPEFIWFSTQAQNIQLVTRFVLNNKNKAVQIFFYTSKIFASLYCYERSIIYSLTCFQLIIQMYSKTKYSTMVWLVGTDIGFMSFSLGKIDQALAVFDWSCQMIKKTQNKINFSNFQFLLFPMYILFVREETEKYKKFKQLSIERLAAHENSKISELWKNLTVDLTDMKAIIEFLKFFKSTAQFPSRSLIKIIIFVIEYLEPKLDSNDFSKQKINIMKEDLQIASNCLVNFENIYECYKPLSKIFVLFFGQDKHKYNFQQIQKIVSNNQFNKIYCYELQIHMTTLKYVFKTCKKFGIKPIKQYARHMINLGKLLHKIKNHYLIDIYYLVLIQFCQATVLANKKTQNGTKPDIKKSIKAIKIFCRLLSFNL